MSHYFKTLGTKTVKHEGMLISETDFVRLGDEYKPFVRLSCLKFYDVYEITEVRTMLI